VATVIAIPVGTLKTSVVSSFHALIGDANVPSDIFIIVRTAVVAVASWVNRDKTLFFTNLVVIGIGGRPSISLAMEVE